MAMSSSRLESEGVVSNEWGQINDFSSGLSKLVHEKERRIVFIRDSAHNASSSSAMTTILTGLSPSPHVVAWEFFGNEAEKKIFEEAINRGSVQGSDEFKAIFEEGVKTSYSKSIPQIVLDNVLEDIPADQQKTSADRMHFRLTEGDRMRADVLQSLSEDNKTVVIMFGNAHCFAPGTAEVATSNIVDTCEHLQKKGVNALTISFLDPGSAASKVDFHAAIQGSASSGFLGKEVTPNATLSDIYLLPGTNSSQFIAVDFEKFITAYKEKRLPPHVLSATGLEEGSSFSIFNLGGLFRKDSPQPHR